MGKPVGKVPECQPAPQIRAICFDAGDTLIFDDPPLDQRIANALEGGGLVYYSAALPEAVRQMQRVGLSLYLTGDALDSPQLVAQCTESLLQSLALPSTPSDVAALAGLFAAQPYRRVLDTGVLPLLTELKRRGFLLAIISDWEPDLPDVLSSLGVRHLFDCISVSSLVGATKPDARLFHHALDCLNVPPDSALHVGDYAELDAVGARASGMSAVVYDRRGLYHVSPPDIDFYFETFAALKSFLLALPSVIDC